MRSDSGDLNLGTKVINAVVSPSPNDKLEDPVEMTFEKNIVSIQSPNVASTWINHEYVFKKCIFLSGDQIFNFYMCCVSIKGIIVPFRYYRSIYILYFLKVGPTSAQECSFWLENDT